MQFRFLGLLPAFAVLAAGAAHAQSTGQMAFPEPLNSGKVTTQAPARNSDTGSMSFPASPGGVPVAAPRTRDTGNMAVPTGGGNLTPGTATATAAATPAATTPTPAASSAPAAPVHHAVAHRRAVRHAQAVRRARATAPSGSVDVPSSADK